MRIQTLSAVLGALLVLTACGDSESAPRGEATESASEGTSSTPPPEPKPGMTAPGAELAIGEAATVPVRTFEDPVGGTAEITVVSIEAVPQDEVDSSGYADADATVHLVRAEARLTKVTDLRIFDPAVDLVASTTDGDIATALSPEDAELFGCEGDSDASPDKGAELTICEAVAAPKGGEVDHVQFAPYAGDYSAREGAPLTWR